MFKKIEKFITGLGDFNHAFVTLLLMIIVSGTFILLANIEVAVYVSAIIGYGLSAFYYGKEHWTYIKLGELKSLNPNNWHKHDRRQTMFVWFVAAAYPIFLWNIF